jgi:2,5-diamino-6-(ribosylamino)-4(3H)-pyrimidinone 5'-phosphate reductase
MKRPRVLVNVAMTADGKIDTAARKGAFISSAADKARVDQLRASVDAVLVGGRTLLNEDPRLTVRSPELRAERIRRGLPENPAKVGVVSEIPFFPKVQSSFGGSAHPGSGSAQVSINQFLTSGPAQVYLFTTRCNEPEAMANLEKAGVMVRVMGTDRVDLEAVFRSLGEEGIHTVLVEGGGTIIAELFHLGLVDEITIYIAPMIFGGATSPTLADGPGFLKKSYPRLKLKSVDIMDDEGGILIHYLIKN